MPFTTAGKNLMLAAVVGTNPATPITHVGGLDADAGKSATGVASTDVFTSRGHGYSDGNLVVLSALTGGTGLVAADPYFIRDSTTDTFKLCRVPAGTAVDFSTDVSAGTVTRLVELSGGSYARVSIAYNAPADGTMDDSTNGAVLNVPASATLDYISYHSASTSGTLLLITPLSVPETYGSAGTYTVTDSDLTLTS